MPRRLSRLACAAVLALAPQGAPAQTGRAPLGWVVEEDRSSIGIVLLLDGQPAHGAFRKFTGEGEFDPDDPGAASFTMTVDSASVDFGNAVFNAFVTSAEGLESANYPVIFYRLQDLQARGGDAYLATGTITLKGRSETLTTPITLRIGPDRAHAEGRLELDRRRFRLGVGPFSAMADIGPKIGVPFRLEARPRR